MLLPPNFSHICPCALAISICWLCHWFRHLWKLSMLFLIIAEIISKPGTFRNKRHPWDGDLRRRSLLWSFLSSWRRIQYNISYLVFLQFEQSYAELAQISHKKLTLREQKLNLESFIPKAEFVINVRGWGCWSGVEWQWFYGSCDYISSPWMLNYSPTCHTSRWASARNVITPLTRWKRRLGVLPTKLLPMVKRDSWFKISLHGHW